MTRVAGTDSAGVEAAAAVVRDGGILVYPTETVYGLGANALDGVAVAKIFAAKNRPAINPVIVHVANRHDAEKYVECDARAKGLMAAFWPGPLTLILPKKNEGGISDLVSAGLQTIAIRMPSHPVALKLLEETRLPIAAPSANASGEPSATTPKHVTTEFKGCPKEFPVVFGSFQGGHTDNMRDPGADENWIAKETWDFFMRF